MRRLEKKLLRIKRNYLYFAEINLKVHHSTAPIESEGFFFPIGRGRQTELIIGNKIFGSQRQEQLNEGKSPRVLETTC